LLKFKYQILTILLYLLINKATTHQQI